MKEIFKRLNAAARDEKLTDAAFRRVVRDTFEKRQRSESILIAFLRALDVVKAGEG